MFGYLKRRKVFRDTKVTCSDSAFFSFTYVVKATANLRLWVGGLSTTSVLSLFCPSAELPLLLGLALW